MRASRFPSSWLSCNPSWSPYETLRPWRGRPVSRIGRAAVAILHDQEGGRIVVFRIGPGQRVAEHTSASQVLLTVVSGTGYITGAEGEEKVNPGELIAFAPREPHGMRADRDELILAAHITPRPRSR